MKFKFIKIGLFSATLLLSSNSFALTLEEALGKAYSNNPELLSQREALKAVDQELPKAYSGMLPNANLVLNNNRTTSDDVNFFTNPGGKKKDYYNNSSSVELGQSLFGGGETYYSIESARERIKAARFTLEKSEQEFLYTAVETYLNMIHAKKVLELAEKNEAILKDQLKATKERFSLGDATKTDISQSEARYANSTSARIVSEGDFISASARFRRVFLMDVPEDLSMPKELPKIPETLDKALDTALVKNYDAKIAEYNKNSTRYDTKTARSALLPQVDANASIGQREYYSGASIQETQQETVGITVTVPLYEGGANYANVRQAKDRSRQAAYEFDNTLLQVKNAVVDAWQNLITTDTNIESTKKSLEATEVALSGVREEQMEGTRTNLDVLDAQAERFQAEVAHARAIRDSVLAVYRLKAAIGELTPPELNLPVAKYDQLKHYDRTKYKFIGF